MASRAGGRASIGQVPNFPQAIVGAAHRPIPLAADRVGGFSISNLIETTLSPALHKLSERVRDTFSSRNVESKARRKPLTTEEAAIKLQSIARGHATRRASRGATSFAAGVESQFPMWVVPLQVVLSMDSLRSFEALSEQSEASTHGSAIPLLVRYTPGMEVVYVSQHAWLGDDSPDPLGVQLALLKHVLIRMAGEPSGGAISPKARAGNTAGGGSLARPAAAAAGDIECAATVAGYYLASRSRELTLRASQTRAALAHGNGYVWLEHCCTPQAAGLEAARQRAQALASVPTYVANCAYLVALVGSSWRHTAKGELMDKHT